MMRYRLVGHRAYTSLAVEPIPRWHLSLYLIISLAYGLTLTEFTLHFSCSFTKLLHSYLYYFTGKLYKLGKVLLKGFTHAFECTG